MDRHFNTHLLTNLLESGQNQIQNTPSIELLSKNSKEFELLERSFVEADSLLYENKIQEAISAYTRAIEVTRSDISAIRLTNLVSYLIQHFSFSQQLSTMMSPDAKMCSNNSEKIEKLPDIPLYCWACECLFHDPTTELCGHTFCQVCIEDLDFCLKCGSPRKLRRSNGSLVSLKCNVVLVKVVDKFSPMMPSIKIKSKISTLYKEKKFADAVSIIDRETEKDMHMLLLRCKCLFAMNKFKESLSNADQIIEKSPGNLQAHLLRARSLKELSQVEDTISAYLKCLSFHHQHPHVIRMELEKIVHDLLQPNSLMLDDSIAIKNAPSSKTLSSSLSLSMITIPLTAPSSSSSPVQSTLSSSSSLVNILSSASSGTNQKHHHHHSCPYYRHHHSHQQLHHPPCECNHHHHPHVTQLASKTIQQGDRSGGIDGDDVTNNIYKNDEKSSLALTSPPSVPSSSYSASSSVSSAAATANDTTKRDDERIKDKSLLVTQLLSLITLEDLDCSLCYRLLLDPITTPCGHVFCKECLYRSLDYNPLCPLCKESLFTYLALRPQATTESLTWLLENQFDSELSIRKRNHLSELATAACISRGEDIPIFVCTLAFPYLPCPLHVFEPRYRLMMRRCIESGARQFGMCVWIQRPDSQYQYSDTGTMLEIQDLQYLPDGRSVVTTVGRRRFIIQGRGERDGYDVAKVQYISDKSIAPAKMADVSNQLQRTYQRCHAWFHALPQDKRQSIINCYGRFPEFSRNFPHMSNSNGGASSDASNSGGATNTTNSSSGSNGNSNVSSGSGSSNRSSNFRSNFTSANPTRGCGSNKSSNNSNIGSSGGGITCRSSHKHRRSESGYDDDDDDDDDVGDGGGGNATSLFLPYSVCKKSSPSSPLSCATSSSSSSSQSSTSKPLSSQPTSSSSQSPISSSPQTSQPPISSSLLALPPPNAFDHDGPKWLWYMVAILPLDPSVKTSLLASTSLECRLITVERGLEVVITRNWI